ncbi:conserved hypothetical protein [Brugia malayi]|nr:uncharacterized protein BM_BM13049 [Brugia malayi]VIO87327.1 conserved hypothetical protein [Brugia malayi]
MPFATTAITEQNANAKCLVIVFPSGAMCINLAGSFKCECLPGYQKLDDRSMDVMRV